MMLTTHVLAGLALALPVVVIAPEFAVVAPVAGAVGGALPDADMYAGHRRTLHFPVWYSIVSGPALVLALVVPTTATVALALVLVGAAVHCVMDVFGGGLELRPWEGRSDRAVYDHYHDRWIPPRQLIGYDGSPKDLALAAALAVPSLVVLEAPFHALVLALLGISTIYVLLRRRLAALAPVLVARLPVSLRRYVPERYVEDD